MPRIQRVLTSSLFNSKSNFNYFHIKYFSISLFSLLDVLVIRLCFTDLFRFHIFQRAMAIFLTRCQNKKKNKKKNEIRDYCQLFKFPERCSNLDRFSRYSFLTRELRACARASYRYDVGNAIRSLDWSIPVNFF